MDEQDEFVKYVAGGIFRYGHAQRSSDVILWFAASGAFCIGSKLEELEKAYKKEKNHKVRARMVAVRMVRVRNMSVSETADIQGRCPNWVRNWLRRYDEGGLEGLQDLLRHGRPRSPRDVVGGIIANVAGCRITPVGMQQYDT